MRKAESRLIRARRWPVSVFELPRVLNADIVRRMKGTPHSDLFGEALRDCAAGHHGRLLTIRRDDDHVDAHDPALYFAEQPFDHEIELLARAKGPVLDVGCGAGRTLLWLQHHGIAATGIDLSPGAVDVCRQRGCADVRFVDIMDPQRQAATGGGFGTAIVFGNNIGIGGTREGALRLLQRLAQEVVAGGQLLVTGLEIARTTAAHHIAYHDRNRAAGRPIGEIVMRFEYEGATSPWCPWYHPTANELRDLAAATTGWQVEDIRQSDGPFYAAILRKPRRA